MTDLRRRMLRILYVSQYFPPEVCAPAVRVYEFSREWVKLGHEVTVLTGFAHHPTGIKAPADRWRVFRRETKDSISVVRTYVWAAPNRGTVRRMISYASFLASAVTLGRFGVSRPDIVVATSPQLLCALAGYFIARSMRRPFVFEVRDLWPESVLAVGAMRENIIVRGMRRVARMLYRRSDAIVTVGEGYRLKIHELYGIPLDKMDVVYNGADTAFFTPGPRDNEIRREWGWGDRFVALYLGTHGMAHGLETVLGAAEKLRDRKDILFVFVGEGAEKERLKTMAAAKRLENVQFVDQQPRERVRLFYAACDMGIVTLRKAELFSTVIPSKLFEHFSMERPVLISVDGEARRLVEEAGAGEFVPQENAGALADAVVRWSADRKRLAEMGRKGRVFVIERFDRRALAERYIRILQSVACGRPQAASRDDVQREPR